MGREGSGGMDGMGKDLRRGGWGFVLIECVRYICLVVSNMCGGRGRGRQRLGDYTSRGDLVDQILGVHVDDRP